MMSANWFQPQYGAVPTCAGRCSECRSCVCNGGLTSMAGTRSLAGAPVVPRPSTNPQVKALLAAVDVVQGLDAKLQAAGVELWVAKAASAPHNIATTVVLTEAPFLDAQDTCALLAGLNGYVDGFIYTGMVEQTVQKVCNDKTASLEDSLAQVAAHDPKAAKRLSLVMEANAEATAEEYADKMRAAFAKGAWHGVQLAVQVPLQKAGELAWSGLIAAVPLLVAAGVAFWLFQRGKQAVQNPRRTRGGRC